MILVITPEIRARLKQEGFEATAESYQVPDEAYNFALSAWKHIDSPEIEAAMFALTHPSHGELFKPAMIEARTGQQPGSPDLSDQLSAARAAVFTHESLKELVREHFPKLREDFAAVKENSIATAQAASAVAVELGILSTEVTGLEPKLAKGMSDIHREQVEVGSAATRVVVDCVTKLGKVVLWGVIAIVALLVLNTLLALRAHAQHGTSRIDVIQFQSSAGSTVGTFAAPFTFKAGANCTASKSGGVLTFNCTGGAGGAPAWDAITAPTSGGLALTQFANGDAFFTVTRNTDSAPTGSFFDFKNHAGVSVCKLDIAGTFSACAFPYANLTSIPSTFAPSAHNLLSSAHGDTTVASAVRGDGIFAIGATPTWQRLAHPSASGGYFKWNGTDVVASTLAASGTGTPTVCTNQAVTGFTLSADAAPTSTCTTITSAFTSGTFSATAHNLLSATHGDTVAASPVRGDIIIANSTPAWTKLALGAATAGKYAKSNGTDVVISSGSASGTGTPTACSNQAVTGFTLNADAAPTSTCTTLTSSFLPNTVVYNNQANTYSGGGLQDFHAMKLTPPTSTVASLPTASSNTNVVYEVTDGASASDCVTGSGTTQVWCVSTGSAWTTIGDGGSGGGGVTSVATSAPLGGGTITTTGTLTCATCVTSSSPGAGLAHFAGSTQAVTSSAVVQADVTNGYVDLSSTQATVAGLKTFTTGIVTKNENTAIRYCDQYASAGAGTSGSPWTGWEACVTGISAPGGIAKFPAGVYQTGSGMTVSVADVTIEGSGIDASIIQADPALNSTVLAIDAAGEDVNWNWGATCNISGQLCTKAMFTTITLGKTVNTSTPYPAKGSRGIYFTSDVTALRTITRTIASTNLNLYGNIGFWAAAGKNSSAAIFFTISDGTNTSCWSIANSSVYNQWTFFNKPLGTPDKVGATCTVAPGGATPAATRTAITSVGFAGLEASTRYYADEIQAWNSDLNLFNVSGANFLIHDITVNHVDANNGSVAYLNGSSPSLRHVKFTGGLENVFADVGATYISIQDSYFDHSTHSGIYSAAPQPRIIANHITNMPHDGIQSFNTSSSVITGNQVDTVGAYGIELNNDTGGTISGNSVKNVETFGLYNIGSTGVTVSSNYVEAANEVGIQFQSDCNSSSVIGNTIYSTGKNAIDINSRGVSVIGNMIRATGASNGYPTAEAKCINILPNAGTGHMSVIGNYCRDAGVNGSGNTYGIHLQTPLNDFVVESNEIFNAANTAIQVDATVSNGLISGNQIDLNAVAGVQGIVLLGDSQISVDNNFIRNPAALGAVGLIDLSGTNAHIKLSNNDIDMNTVATIVGIKIAGTTTDATLQTNHIYNVGSGSAISDAGTLTTFFGNDTNATKEQISPIVTTASTATTAGFNIPSGTAPTTPAAGDCWLASNILNCVAQTGVNTGYLLYDSGGVNAITDSSSGTITSYTNNRPLAAATGVQFGINSSNTITQSFSGDAAHSTSQTGKAAAVTTTTLCAATANTACGQAGTYRVSYNFYGSGTACSSVTAGSVGLNLTWTDTNAVAHTTISMPLFDQKAGTLGILFNFNTALGTEGASGVYVVSTNGTIIQFATTYTACTTGTGTYNLKMTVEQIL